MVYGLWLMAFVVGTAAGSFLNLVADRLPREESIFGRSYCPHCRKKLLWWELVPIASFFVLRGKCSACKQPIPREHPLIELATGVLFAIVVWRISEITNYQLPITNYFSIVYGWFVVSVLIVVFLADLKYYIIPDKVVVPAALVAVATNAVQDITNYQLSIINYQLPAAITSYRFLYTSPFFSGLFAALIAASFFLLLIVASRGRWMGLGDVKFGAFMGLVVGWPGIIPAIFSAFFLGSLVAIPLLFLKRKTMKSFLPFGTFLAVSAFVWFVWGSELNRWVLYTFLGL